MNNIITRHISFVENGQTYLVSTRKQNEYSKEYLRVRFVFESNSSGLEYIVVDNEMGDAQMITSRGNQFYSGTLFDQLLTWFNEIEMHWHHSK